MSPKETHKTPSHWEHYTNQKDKTWPLLRSLSRQATEWKEHVQSGTDRITQKSVLPEKRGMSSTSMTPKVWTEVRRCGPGQTTLRICRLYMYVYRNTAYSEREQRHLRWWHLLYPLEIIIIIIINNNNNGYLERLTRTGPKRLHTL